MAMSARVWLEGLGSRLVPHERVEIARLSDGERVVFCHHGEPMRQAMVAPRDGALALALGADTTSAAEVFAFMEPIDPTPDWRMVTSGFSCDWPQGWTIFDTPHDVAWPFELVQTHPQGEAMVYLQGFWPRAEAPELDGLVAEGMQLAGRAELAISPTRRGEWIALVYEHAGVASVQYRLRLDLEDGRAALVTAQAPAPMGETAFAAARTLATSLALHASPA